MRIFEGHMNQYSRIHNNTCVHRILHFNEFFFFWFFIEMLFFSTSNFPISCSTLVRLYVLIFTLQQWTKFFIFFFQLISNEILYIIFKSSIIILFYTSLICLLYAKYFYSNICRFSTPIKFGNSIYTFAHHNINCSMISRLILLCTENDLYIITFSIWNQCVHQNQVMVFQRNRYMKVYQIVMLLTDTIHNISKINGCSLHSFRIMFYLPVMEYDEVRVW